jgi:hypothetical protein
MIRKIALAGAATVALAIGSAGIASASLSTSYQAVADGTAGYYNQAGLTVHDIGAVITTQPAALNIGGVGTGGIGVQGCDPNNGWGFQEGVVSNGVTLSVDYQVGVLKGANADNCVGNGVLPDPLVLNHALTGLPVGDAVTLYASYGTYKKTNGTKAQGKGQIFGAVTFQATDADGFETYTETVWKLPDDENIDMAGAGVEQDTTGMSACSPLSVSNYPTVDQNTGGPGFILGSSGDTDYVAPSGACNDVADFSDVFINGKFGIFGFGPGLADHGIAHQVITTGGGLKANTAIVAPNDTLDPTSGSGESEFSVYAGQVIG